jgi:hypothetical protein
MILNDHVDVIISVYSQSFGINHSLKHKTVIWYCTFIGESFQ